MGPILFFGLSLRDSYTKQRDFSIEVGFSGEKTKELDKFQQEFGSHRHMYQGYPVGGICFSRGLKPDKAYAIEFRGGRGKGGVWAGKAAEFKNYIVVVEKELKLDWTGKEGSGYWSRQLKNVDKYWAFVYENEKGVGIMLLEQGSPVSDTVPQVTSQTVSGNTIPRISPEEINNKKVSVRRSVIGVWGEQVLDGIENGSKKCKNTDLRKGQPIYRGYGMLNFNGMPKSGVRVLDWIFIGEKDRIKFNEGEWVTNKTTDGKTGIGRYDYFEGLDTIKKGYLSKLSDLRVDSEGIKNGKGEKITWSDKFRPTIIATLEK
ncbi:hypothetical protein [Mycoplasma wenyonii]|nr:hypothetical protein [Mycoplasma wenyonii]